MGFPGGSEVKASAHNAGDLGSIPGLGRSPGEGNGNPLQYSCLENPMDGGAWWATVHGVAKSRTRLSDFTFTFTMNKASGGDGPITPWQIDGETMEIVTDFIFLGSKITVDGTCSHEKKRYLLLGRKAMTNLDSILKNRDITLPTKIHLVKVVVFPVVMYGCESWSIKKTEHQRIDVFELWCWRRFLRVPWTSRRSNQSILREINPECPLEGLMLKLKLKYFGHLM